MKIVIDISEEIYKTSQIVNAKHLIPHLIPIQIPLKVIANGTPLPKEHGRLIDEKVIIGMADNESNWVYDLVDLPDYIAGLPAVIPAESEEEQ